MAMTDVTKQNHGHEHGVNERNKIHTIVLIRHQQINQQPLRKIHPVNPCFGVTK